jgi:hypothetical protein
VLPACRGSSQADRKWSPWMAVLCCLRAEVPVRPTGRGRHRLAVLCCLRAVDPVRPTGRGRHRLAVLCCLRAVDLVRPTGRRRHRLAILCCLRDKEKRADRRKIARTWCSYVSCTPETPVKQWRDKGCGCI